MSGAAEPGRTRLLAWARLATTLVVLGGAWVFLVSNFRPSLIFLNTMTGGGDTPSYHHPIEHLRDVLLPAGNPQGWDLGNFAGYAPYQFYFLPPSLAIVGLGTIIPINIAFKLVTVSGTFLLPLAGLLALRGLGYAFPVPALGAVASLAFLFNEGNSMWGGNIPSTLAGEFAFSLGFGLAVIFFGCVYRGIETGRGWRTLAIVLALAGLCHPVAFLNATLPPLFFLLDRQRFARNLRYLLRVYVTAVLLMAFWLFPLMAKIGYATSINWTWHFQSWREILPKVLQPIAVLAALDALWVIIRPTPATRAGRYVLFGIVVTAIAFYNATSVGLPEIRFAPFAQFLMILLAVDLVARLLGHVRAAALPALALAAGTVAWVNNSVTYIPQWIKWNYEGLEKKATYPTLMQLMNALKGKLSDPRIAYENSPQYERFGSMRIFESLPHFTHRATLEGLLLQTPVTSPFVYYIQSEISVAGTGVIPGYPYPTVNPQRGTLRLDLFNAQDLLAITPTVKDALAKDPRWERSFDLPPYAIFHRKGADPHYVRVPRYRPVAVETMRWKRDFHRWFATDTALEVPIVAANTIPEGDRARFPLTSRSPTDLPHEPLGATCTIDEHIEDLAIDFTTTCPGLPHEIAVSYSPNWRVEGARRVYMTSPAFMLVFPDGPHVRLVFRRVAIDWVGIVATFAGLAFCFVPVRRRVAGSESATGLDRTLTGAQPVLVGTGLVVILAATLWNIARADGPTYYYQLGWKAFEKQDYPTAIHYFDRTILLGGDTTTAGDGTFFRAASLLRSGKPAEALEGYRAIIEGFPAAIWVAESYYHVGLCLRQLRRLREAKASFRYVMVNYPGNRWAGFAKEQMDQLHQEARMRRGRG
jgi:hypothetical protein